MEEIPAKLSDVAGINWSQFNQNILDTTIFQGKYYSLPVDTQPMVLYCNKDFLAQLGPAHAQSKPELGTGLESFLTALEQLQQSMPGGSFPLSVPSNGANSIMCLQTNVWWRIWQYHILLGYFYTCDSDHS